MNRTFFALMILLAVCVIGCLKAEPAPAKAKLKASDLTVRYINNLLTADEFKITNKSGHELIDADVNLSVTDIEGRKYYASKFWGYWKSGETRSFSSSDIDGATEDFLLGESMDSVQRIEVYGSSTEYEWEFAVRVTR